MNTDMDQTNHSRNKCDPLNPDVNTHGLGEFHLLSINFTFIKHAETTTFSVDDDDNLVKITTL